MIGILVAAVVGIVGIGFLATSLGGGGDGDESVAAPTVEIVGDAIAPMPEGLAITDASTDPSAGTVAPTFIGTDFDGGEVTIEPDGRAKAIYFLAHWCPHCQAEVPVVQALIDDGQQPENLDIYAVSTAVDSTRGNFPPEEWLSNESFTPTVLRDDADLTAYNSTGPAGFPFVLYLDADHQVVGRSAGTLDAGQMQALWTAAASS